MLNARLELFAQRDLVLGWSDAERKKIQNSISNLTYWLNHKLEVSQTIIFGSWTRNTILPRKYDESSDIDIMVVFQGNLYNRDPETCRDLLRKYVAGVYSSSYVRKDAPAVKLELNFIKYDLVPAIVDELTGQYYIPNTGYSEGWMLTSPKDLDPRLESANVSLGGNIVRNVIRLCKYLNKSTERSSLSSYELESFIVDNISSLSNLISQRTYDYFIGMMRLMLSSACSPQTMANIRDCIEYYRGQENRDGQITWLRKILPGFIG